MSQMFEPGLSLRWDLIWQSTAFLSLGLAASLALRRCPARAHSALLIATLAAIGTPLLARAIRVGEWGLLHPPAASEPGPAPVAGMPPIQPPPPTLASVPSPTGSSSHPMPSVPGVGLDGLSIPQPHAESTFPISGRPTPPRSFPIRAVLLVSWAIASLLSFSSLLASFALARRLLRASSPVTDSALHRAASEASSRLGLSVAPDLRVSPSVRCPSVWCWSRRPILLVPAGVDASDAAIDWVSIFAHELAHWHRLDHVSSMLFEALVCVLPWNPLAWWSRSRLGQLAELSCDDWVLASGSAGEDYADSLLRLTPRRRSPVILAAVTRRAGLIARVRHILEDRRSNPRIGTLWGLSSALAALAAASALALAQAGPGRAVVNDSPPADTTDHLVRGKVLGPDGQPVSGADVIWVGTRRPALPYAALPRDQDRTWQSGLATLARTTTAADGTFTISAPIDEGDLIKFNGIFSQLVVLSKGLGMTALDVDPQQPEVDVTIQMPSETLIHGHLLTPSGMPASGVRVVLGGIRIEERDTWISAGSTQDDSLMLDHWPRPLMTDASGEFTLAGVPSNTYADLSFWHPDFAVDEVTVTTRTDGLITPAQKGFEIVPVEPEFTHTLEPARPVAGRVTDKATGQPLAGLLVEMTPMRRHGGMPFTGRTDADGRYRISGHSSDNMYFTTVFPPSSSGYLDAKDMQDGWPAGVKVLEKNFALEKGRLVTGRVVNGATKQPVAGAAVVYQPALKNPNRSSDHDFGNPTITDADGRFKITTLPGEGGLAVESPDDSMIRAAATGTAFVNLPTIYPHAYTSIDVPEDGNAPTVEIEVHPGPTLEARVLGPDGELVKGVTASYKGMDAVLLNVWNHGREWRDGIFRISGADPNRKYRVFFVDPDRHLGGVAELSVDPDHPGPFEVTLQPTATIRGRAVYQDGTPASPGQVMPFLAYSAEPKELSRNDRFSPNVVEFYSNFLGQRHFHLHDRETGSQGEFEFQAMLPGAWFSVSASGSGRSGFASTPILQPGQTYDLGTITLAEDRP